ncbi:putative transcription factor MYB family [Lupinus albus]|uniref:Putative transcription factor MYB family n=1 Tax=Lupinus albus TaxID=3870 RepID=A0A6A4QNV6_LUPAL|nr:putative transcription factor MYB family [Lupinus albus]
MVVDQKVENTNGIDGAVNGAPPCSAVDGGYDGRPWRRLPRWTRKEILVLIQGKTDAENLFRPGPAFGSVEPKWVSVSRYCKDHGMNRGAVQCRKRWSNMVGDCKKIKEWENQIRDETESFWVMRNDLRRERKLPGYFDREVYDILDAVSPAAAAAAAAAVGDVEVHIYDSNRKMESEDGLFSDNNERDEVLPQHHVKDVPISVFLELHIIKKGEPSILDTHLVGEYDVNNLTVASRRRKRKRFATDGEEETLQSELIDVLERNGKMVEDKLESGNLELDMQQQKDNASNIVDVLDKLANALGRIADKL